DKAHVVGLSMGGYIGLDFLVMHPGRLLSVTLASGDVWNGSPGPAVPWSAEAVAKRRNEIQELYKRGVFQFKQQWLNALTVRDGMMVPEIRQSVWNMIYKWDAWQPAHIEPRFLLGTSVIDKLKQIRVEVPVLVLTGAADTHDKNHLIELVPSAKHSILPDAGHLSNLENPRGFNWLVQDFLESQKKK
ncbi:MAG TPA: alpha/beta hydrolase, partial [Niabella sp.]|nr:alpha/beta hydrolase [Niabella sp.]